MISFNSNVRVTNIGSLHSEGMDMVVNMSFNTGHTLLYPKIILDLIYMLSGKFGLEHIMDRNIGSMDIDSRKVLDELLNWELVNTTSDGYNDRYIQAKDELKNHTIHFPKMTNKNIMIAVLLQKIHVKTVFYDNKTITKSDVNLNIYFEVNDIGKNVISFIQDEMKVDTVSLASSNFCVDNLKEDIDIIVNSDATNWINIENCITINTWNYRNTRFDDFKLFNDKITVSDNLQPLIEGYILAIRSIDDMIYSVIGELVF